MTDPVRTPPGAPPAGAAPAPRPDVVTGSAPPAHTELLAALGRAYVDMVRLFRAGDQAAARAVRDTIQAQLGGAVERTYRGALAELDAGRPGAAFRGFSETLELHRLNVANLALPVDVAACYDGLR